jgi:hypothetical protein
MQTGKFIATVSVSGRGMDAKGNIISRDTNGLPPVWLSVLAGSIPNRQTLSGSIAQRMGILLDSNGIIAPGEKSGQPFAKRTIYGQWLHASVHDDFGPQYTWTMIKDLTLVSVMELEQSIEFLGAPDVFTVERAELPSDYVHKTQQHIGRAKLDPHVHNTTGATESNPVQTAREKVGAMRSDKGTNPEVVVDAETVIKKNKIAK